MIISTEGVFIAPWHLAPKELVKEQGSREQWIYLTSTQFSYLKMLGKPTNSEQSTNTGYKLTCSLCQLVDIIAVFQVGTGVTSPTMVAPKFYSHYINDRHRHVEVYVHNLVK